MGLLDGVIRTAITTATNAVGGHGILHVKTGGYDPVTGEDSGTFADYPVRITPPERFAEFTAPVGAKAGDAKIIVSGEGLPDLLAAEVVEATVLGRRWVVAVVNPISGGDAVGGYELVIRR